MSELVSGRYYNVYYPGDGWKDRESSALNAKDCDDTVGWPDRDNPFRIVHNRTAVPVLNGELKVGESTVREYADCPINFTPQPLPPEAQFPWTIADREDQHLTVLERGNPSKAHVSVPTAIGELKDVPSMIQDWGRTHLKNAAKAHLSWRWGIKPVIRDITLMFKFCDAVSKRVKMFENLRDKGHISVRVGLGGDELMVRAPSRTTLESTLGYKQAYRDVYYTSKVWGSVRYTVNKTMEFPQTDAGMLHYARLLTLGITSYEALLTAWELLPWSWFVDWFVGVGDFLSTGNNTVGVQSSGVCIMRTTTSKTQYRDMGGGVNSDWFSVRGQYWERQSVKVRYVDTDPSAPYTVAATLPFLEASKLSILGALVVLKAL
jgi:hypothetical protein